MVQVFPSLPPLERLAVYQDPVARIWVGLWRRLGISVERSAGVYAASDGRGRLHIGTPETLDADDCLAQMLLHELCHALIEGPASLGRPDWGLENADDRHVHHEHAALKLQAHLLRAHGLEHLLAPTTEFRGYYERLGPVALDALDAGDETAARLASGGLARATEPPLGDWLAAALSATRVILEAAAHFEQLIGVHTNPETAVAPVEEAHASQRVSSRT